MVATVLPLEGGRGRRGGKSSLKNPEFSAPLDNRAVGTETAFHHTMRTPPLAFQNGRIRQLTHRPVLAIAVAIAFYTTGCLSNEYVIPKTELARLSQLPPEQRGQRVEVVQDIGDRRGPALDPQAPPPPPGYGDPAYPQGQGYVDSGPNVGVGIMIDPLGFGPSHHRSYRSHAVPAPRAAPTRAAPGAPRSVGKKAIPSKGGGKSDELAALLVVMAVVVTLGAVVTEGARYDGYAAMYPEQPIYLKDAAGGQRVLPLAAITPADAAATVEAKVMDDEGWGMSHLGRRPLDRKGFAFKLELGSLASQSSGYDFNGMGFSPQFGYFPHQTLGLLAKSTLEWGTDSANNSLTRQSLAFELQFLPLSVWRLHFGGFAHVGNQWASDPQGKRSGLALGGGAMIELALTTRLAFAFRYDYSQANIGDAGHKWAPVSMIGGGLAIY